MTTRIQTVFLQKQSTSIAIMQVLLASLFLGILAQIKIPLLFTPIPLTLQTLGVLLVGALLGRVQGTMSVLLYLCYCTLGLPFVSGGMIEPLALIGLKGGYIMGFIVQAFLMGWYYEKPRSSSINCLVTYGICIIQLLMGSVWLYTFIGLSAFIVGFFPFVIGEFLKSIAVTKIMMIRNKSY